MLNLKIESPFLIDAFDDMIMAIFERKKFYEYHVSYVTWLNGLRRYVVDFNSENGDTIFTGTIDIWQENEKNYVEFTEL